MAIKPTNPPIINPVRKARVQRSAQRLRAAAQDAARTTAAELKGAAGDMKQAASNAAQDAKRRLQEAAIDTADAGLGAAEALEAKGRAAASAAAGSVQESYYAVDDYVRAKPVQALGAALVAGIVIGLMVRR